MMGALALMKLLAKRELRRKDVAKAKGKQTRHEFGRDRTLCGFMYIIARHFFPI